MGFSQAVQAKEASSSLSAGFIRNSLWNFAGLAAPLAVAFLAIPPLMRACGVERFGLLNLAWSVIGYFSLFDLGLGRALTKTVAEKFELGRESEAPEAFWSALLLMGTLGCAGGLLLLAVPAEFMLRMFHVPAALQTETVRSLSLIALMVPLVTTTAAFRGFLEARQKFAFLSVVRTVTGALTFAAPLLVVWFSNRLEWLIAVLGLARLIAWLACFWFCMRVMPALRRVQRMDGRAAHSMLRFGGWMTVSNVVSPLMMYLDRFLMGGMISVQAVAFYATPQEGMIRILLVPNAIMGVLFPSASATLAAGSHRLHTLYASAVRTIIVTLFPICLGAVLFAREALTVWLGAAFAAQSWRVLQWLAIGVMLNGFANAPFTLIQAGGRPDLTAKLHLLELPAYVAAAVLLILRFGITGAAIAWTSRIALDAALLSAIAMRWMPRREMQFCWLALSLATLAAGMGLEALPVLWKALLAASGMIPLVWHARSIVLGGRASLSEREE